MQKISVPGRIDEQYRLVAENATLLNKFLKAHGNHSIRITIELFGNHRSTPQNRYYWGVLVFMIKERFKELGHDLSSDNVHDFLKKEFNYTEVLTNNDYFLKVPQSTSNMSTVSFIEYVEKIRFFAAHVLEIDIPDPDINYTTTIFI